MPAHHLSPYTLAYTHTRLIPYHISIFIRRSPTKCAAYPFTPKKELYTLVARTYIVYVRSESVFVGPTSPPSYELFQCCSWYNNRRNDCTRIRFVSWLHDNFGFIHFAIGSWKKKVINYEMWRRVRDRKFWKVCTLVVVVVRCYVTLLLQSGALFRPSV